MNITIIIPTKDRPAELQRCLQSIAEQTLACQEVIIIDASTPFSETTLQRWQTQLPLKVIRAKQPSSAQQRNFGLDQVQATCDIVLFIDDDIILSPNVLEQTARFFSTHSDAVGVTGTIVGEIQHGLVKRWLGRITLLYTPVPFGLTKGVFNIVNQAQHVQITQWLPGAAAYRWSLVKQLRFDAWFTGYGLAEDLDYSLQAQAFGQEYVDPEIIMEHRHSPQGRNWEQFGWLRIINRNFIRQKQFSQRWDYWLGFWWANVWLVLFNTVRGFWSQRFRQEGRGNWRGIMQLIRSQHTANHQ